MITLDAIARSADDLAGYREIVGGSTGRRRFCNVIGLVEEILRALIVALFEIAVHEQDINARLYRRVGRFAADALKLVVRRAVVADGDVGFCLCNAVAHYLGGRRRPYLLNLLLLLRRLFGRRI